MLPFIVAQPRGDLCVCTREYAFLFLPFYPYLSLFLDDPRLSKRKYVAQNRTSTTEHRNYLEVDANFRDCATHRRRRRRRRGRYRRRSSGDLKTTGDCLVASGYSKKRDRLSLKEKSEGTSA